MWLIREQRKRRIQLIIHKKTDEALTDRGVLKVPKRRIYEVAKQFKVSSEALVSLLRGLKYDVRSHMSIVDEKMEADIRKKFENEKAEVKRRDERKREKHKEIAKKEEIEKRTKKKRKQEKPKKKVLKPSQKRRRRRRERPAIDKQEVAESVKRTLASMEGRKPVRRRRKRVVKGEGVEIEEGNIVRVSEFVSVAELAHQMDVTPAKLISKCMELGLMVTINQRLDMDTITMVADEFGYEVEQIEGYILDEILEEKGEVKEDLQPRAPVVTVMGHVDHGKTSLLDYIRKSNIIAGEKGGITQHIGAYEIQLSSGKIAFLDTPGHEAFTAMRARGAQITDIVVLIVAADDSVMPQTIEAIDHARAAGVPIIVAVNKIDLPAANPEAIKQQLTKHGLTVEEWGGRTIACDISAKTGEGIDKLLEMILLQAELLELKANVQGKAQGVIVESLLDKGLGSVATVLVQRGTLRKGDSFVTGLCYGKVRTLSNEWREPVRDPFYVVDSDREAREISFKRRQLKREEDFRRVSKRFTLKDIYDQIKSGKAKELNLIIKGDVDGSVEAMCDVLEKLEVEDVHIRVIHKGVGAVSASDILLASASKAIVIGFHIGSDLGAKELAAREQVDVRRYNVIYEAVSEIESALKGLLDPEYKEEILGSAEIREIFHVSKVGVIAGSIVKSGKIKRNAKVRVMRNGELIHDGKISSLKRFKNDVSDVQSGFECGIGVEDFNELQMKDILEVYKLIEIER
jgi:translation initiation factor IF-2